MLDAIDRHLPSAGPTTAKFAAVAFGSVTNAGINRRTDGRMDRHHIVTQTLLHLLCEQHQKVIKTLKTKTDSLYSEKNNASQESVESDLRNENLVNLPSNRSQVQFSIVEPGLDYFLWFSFSTCSRRETSDTS